MAAMFQHGDEAAWRALGAAHRLDAESVPLARARARVLAERVGTFAAGHRLRPIDLGELAVGGHADLPCSRRPTVAVFSAGDGLRPVGQALAAGERADACRPLIIALLQQAGLEPVAWPILPGSAVDAALEDAAQAFDVVIAYGEGFAAVRRGGDSADRQAAFAAAPFGRRSPPAVLVRLPEDREAIARHWPRTVATLLDAMQGHLAPEDAARAGAPSPPADADRGAEVEPAAAAALLARGARLIDVRELDESALDGPAAAERLPLSRIEAGAMPSSLPATATGHDAATLLLLCASGRRSLRAAALLRERGIAGVASVRGGFAAWRAAGLPERAGPRGEARAGTDRGALPHLDAEARARYDRHLRLAGVGPVGQQRLLAARVVVIGAGGLGSPAAFYLAAAGVGSIALIDDDRVERSNLQRQILHVDAALGQAKVDSARERLLALNPSIRVDAIAARLGPDNVEAMLEGADVVIDGSDNFAARYLVDAACLRLRIPLVYGAVERFSGQVSVFDAGRQRGSVPCYRCLFPEPPGADEAPDCAAAGVLGVLPGLIGILQATEALKLILGLGEPLVGRVLTVDALTMRFRTLALHADPDCPGCGAAASFEGYTAIGAYCASR